MLERISIVARTWMTPAVVAGVMFSITPASLGQCEIDELLASDGAAGDRFGRSVSMDGDILIVGSPDCCDTGTGLISCPRRRNSRPMAL